MYKMENTITFNESLKEEVLKNILNKDIDEEGYIVEKDTNERVLAPDGSEVNIEQFAGFENGSEIFIKDDIPSLIKYLRSKK